MSCPGNPPAPAGFTVWKGPVPTELVQWAISLRDHVSGFPYGQTWTMQYTDPTGKTQTVTARKDYHTWTYRGGQLVQGICIPGITLYQAKPTGVVGANYGDPLGGTPDGTEAVYGADVPGPGVNWKLVAVSAGAGALVVGLFWAAVHFMPGKRLRA